MFDATTSESRTWRESTADMFMPTASRMTMTPIHLSMLLFPLMAPRACRNGVKDAQRGVVERGEMWG